MHLANARDLLFDAAERVLRRDGVSGLTSRAVTDEAGVAKGVMHRHFVDFDGFLSELILDRAAQMDAAVTDNAGAGTVIDNLTGALTAAFTPLAVAIVALVITRDGLRERLRQARAPRFPLLAQAAVMVGDYLTEEQMLGRVAPNADIPTLSHMLIGSVHLLFTDREAEPPDTEAVRKVVAGVLRSAVEPVRSDSSGGTPSVRRPT
ncbi:MAG TPA: TetR/AcrR family transcriptional regulator [Acidimicrobiales bacterium]|nr:TetR/AcrR family transcriptional regulator [Acidimicrobiales bacterium]